MRNMSFQKTIEQYNDGSKTVTRRLGWKNLKRGELFMAVEKAMGLKKGEKMNRLGINQVVSTSWEPIKSIAQEDVIREGFPDWTPQQFIEFFCDFNKVTPETKCNRIEFAKVKTLLDFKCQYKVHSFHIDFVCCGYLPTLFATVYDPKGIIIYETILQNVKLQNIQDAFIYVLHNLKIEEIEL